MEVFCLFLVCCVVLCVISSQAAISLGSTCILAFICVALFVYAMLSLPYDATCADPVMFVREGPTLTTFFFLFIVDDGSREGPNNTKSGPTSARQRNAIGKEFRLRADDGPTMKASLVVL